MLHIAADVLIVILMLFSARRLLWVMTSWRSRALSMVHSHCPQVLIVVAFRNEQESLPPLLASLDALDYNATAFSICLVDDASRDAGAHLAASWVSHRSNARLIILKANKGKAEALNRGLASVSDRHEVVVVYDADQRPRPDAVRRLVEPFIDPTTEAVCGYRRPLLRKINAIEAYACLEAWTHQLVNLQAKEILGLNPPTSGGNCAYRRSALERIGGFPAGSLSEDTEVSLALTGSGGRTRFVREAVADHLVVDSFPHYLNQRLRWSRGLMASHRRVSGLEAAFVVTGYLDRVVLVLVITGCVSGYVSPWWLIAYGMPALAAVVTAVVKARAEPWFGCMVIAISPLMFLVDVAASVLSVLHTVTGRPVRWMGRSADSATADTTLSERLKS